MVGLDLLSASDGQPLLPPPSWERLRKLSTNQVPTNLTKGTSTDASEAYVGDFRELFIGMRTQLRVEVSREAGDTTSSAFRNLQAWIRAYMRADVVLVKPNHFVLIDGAIRSMCPSKLVLKPA